MSHRHQRQIGRRILSMETLEGRRLLIAGVPLPDVPPQNYANPEDANYDGAVSPADALIVINELNNPSQSGSPATSSKDIDGDGIVTPRDALLVINRLNSRREVSSVPPEQRAIGLRKALDAGYLPPNMTLSQAQELLETLENGGHYEAGERFRDGQMINIKNLPDDLGGSVAAAEGGEFGSTQQSVVSASENLLPKSAENVEENDPFSLLESAEEALTEHLHDPKLWRNFSESSDGARMEFADRFATWLSELAERSEETDARDRVTRAIAEALQDGDKTVEDIIAELQALRGDV
ncbi:MAG: hypothetical protein HYV60_00390 [Planctomycetia bacterium]|nr:hypothetical protein [Planctomycetia bacterium]